MLVLGLRVYGPGLLRSSSSINRARSKSVFCCAEGRGLDPFTGDFDLYIGEDAVVGDLWSVVCDNFWKGFYGFVFCGICFAAVFL